VATMLEPTGLGIAGEIRAAAEISLDFEGFFRAEYPRLARACLLLTGDAAEAEDLAQEAMARACERWDRVARMDSPTGYVYRSAFNLNRKRLRHLMVRARRLFEPPVPADPADLASVKNQVLTALASVPVPQREALVLVGWFGMDAAEAGRLLGIDASSVRGRLHRARHTLRRTLGGDDG
jgi:RNA polymerase sigma factor (sigma-70 family)